MLVRLLGLVAVERLERKVDSSVLAEMKAALTTLKAERDAQAHTHLKGVAQTVSAPSTTITRFQPVYKGLVELDRRIRDVKWKVLGA